MILTTFFVEKLVCWASCKCSTLIQLIVKRPIKLNPIIEGSNYYYYNFFLFLYIYFFSLPCFFPSSLSLSQWGTNLSQKMTQVAISHNEENEEPTFISLSLTTRNQPFTKNDPSRHLSQWGKRGTNLLQKMTQVAISHNEEPTFIKNDPSRQVSCVMSRERENTSTNMLRSWCEPNEKERATSQRENRK